MSNYQVGIVRLKKEKKKKKGSDNLKIIPKGEITNLRGLENTPTSMEEEEPIH